MATEEDRVAITLFDRPVVSISVKGARASSTVGINHEHGA
jgi:hypothetical protein